MGKGKRALAAERIQEFIRQWRLGRMNHPTTVYSIHTDPEADEVDLTLEDLEAVIDVRAALRKAWADGCHIGLATNPGWDDFAQTLNPYGDSNG